MQQDLFGYKADLDEEFKGLAKGREVEQLVRRPVSACGAMQGIDLGLLAEKAIDAARQAKKSFLSEKGAAFTTWAFLLVRQAISRALRNRSCFNENSVQVPKGKRGEVSFVRLDREPDIHHLSSHEQIEGFSKDPSCVLEARELLVELAEPVMVMLGLLRVIPLSERQRALDIFEGHYALNGRARQTLEDAGKKWGLASHRRPQQIINEVWEKLAIVGSPIRTRFELENTLLRIADLDEVVGELSPMTPSLPSAKESADILGYFALEKAKRKTENVERPYQVGFDLASAPLAGKRGKDRKETMVFAVCQAFGITVEELQAENSCAKPSRARHVAAYLLRSDLNADFDEAGRRIGRSEGMAKHGYYQTKNLLKEGHTSVVQVVETIRVIYRNSMSLPSPDVQ